MIVARMGGLLPTTSAAYSETVYQAEEAVLGGAAIDTDHTGFTGTGFVDQFDAFGKVFWKAEVFGNSRFVGESKGWRLSVQRHQK